MAGGVREAVVVVVPAFTEGNEGQEEIVAGIVLGIESAFSPDVSEGVDKQRAVKQDGGGDEKGPHDELPHGRAEGWRKSFQRPTDGEHDDAEGDGDELVEAIEKHQFGKFHEVGDGFVVGGEISFRGQPTDVRPDKTTDAWGVDVFFFVGMFVMMAMRGSPPQGAALHGGVSDDREDELKSPRGFVRAMRKVAVIETGDCEHADEIERDRRDDRDGANTDPDYSEAAEVQKDER